MHLLCTICSDLINQSDNIYVIKCGHFFHYNCINQWINRSQTCPQCRIKATERCMFRMYPTISNDNTFEDVTTLQSKLDDIQLQLRQENTECKEKDKKIQELNADLKKFEDSLHNSEKKLVEKSSAVSALKEQLKYVQIQNQEVHKLKAENETLNKYMKVTNELQKVLNACSEDVEKMLQDYDDIRTLATFATALKRALCDSEKKKNEYRDRINVLKQKLAAEKARADAIYSDLLQLTHYNTSMTSHDVAMSQKSEMIAEVEVPMESFVRPARLVNAIENSDSPYLSLKQSSLPLTALQRRPTHQLSDRNLKPSEFALLNSVKAACQKPQMKTLEKDSIFHKKEKPVPSYTESELDISYDGLGGHSKLDVFPKPTTSNHSRIPKLSAKHKLKRPSDQDVNAIRKFFKSREK